MHNLVAFYVKRSRDKIKRHNAMTHRTNTPQKPQHPYTKIIAYCLRYADRILCEGIKICTERLLGQVMQTKTIIMYVSELEANIRKVQE